MEIQDSSFSGFIGVAREDITPPVGIYARNWGAAAHDVAEGIHRPLTLTAITFQASRDDAPLVLIAGDLGWWKSRDDEWHVRSGVIEAISLDPVRVMVCLSHTHAGPSIVREDANKPGGEMIAPYLDRLRSACVDATRAALASSQPATLTWRYGRCDLATNRDLRDPTGKPRIVCGFNPEVVADDTLLVGRITENASNRIVTTIVNYACHPTTLAWENRLISPDWVGAMREVIEAETSGAPCAFLQGASGELAPAEQYVGDSAVADRHGRRVGHSVCATLAGMEQLEFAGIVESGAPLAVWKRRRLEASAECAATKIDVELPLKPMPTAAEIEQQWRDTADRVTTERLWRKRNVRRAVGDGDACAMSLWVWRLGDAYLVGQANECYSIFQTELRRRFTGRAIAVMNVVNGHIAYLAPREMYAEDVYGVWQSPFAEGSLEKVIDGAMKTIERFENL